MTCTDESVSDLEMLNNARIDVMDILDSLFEYRGAFGNAERGDHYVRTGTYAIPWTRFRFLELAHESDKRGELALSVIAEDW